jgi:hypothetical protein
MIGLGANEVLLNLAGAMQAVLIEIEQFLSSSE